MQNVDSLANGGYTDVYPPKERVTMALGKLGKVGNSLVVRIPAAMARDLNLIEGAQLEITARYGEITIRSTTGPSRMEAMLATVVEGSDVGEWDTGHAVGAEIFD